MSAVVDALLVSSDPGTRMHHGLTNHEVVMNKQGCKQKTSNDSKAEYVVVMWLQVNESGYEGRVD